MYDRTLFWPSGIIQSLKLVPKPNNKQLFTFIFIIIHEKAAKVICKSNSVDKFISFYQ